ncbi:MAG: tyrosine decarboxylase MfnA [Euryarchaeota archaeon]|nr:tyrosine decarboxylase MfnA [Euryarchaeota archaeon]
MQEKGRSEEEVRSLLREARRKDLSYASGRILSSMCTSPLEVASRAFCEFLETNLGDPGLFPGTRELEEKAVKAIASLLGCRQAKGFIVSGGTEANITALFAAREAAKRPKPEVVVPETAHFSFEKAARMLGLRLVKARVGEDSTVIVEDVERRITPSTVAIVGIAGNTEYGAVDDISALSEIAQEHGLYLHVDAAFGGFVLPFLRELGFPTREFDFSLGGVCSITVDPHKMGLAPVPSGCILFRDSGYLELLQVESPYLTQPRQCTLLGTRSGASAAAVFAALTFLGKEGYRRVVKRCMETTLYLRDGLRSLGVHVHEPWMNLLVFDHPRRREIAQELRSRGWAISRTRRGEIRLVIMPHVKREHAEQFLSDVEEVAGSLPGGAGGKF